MLASLLPNGVAPAAEAMTEVAMEEPAGEELSMEGPEAAPAGPEAALVASRWRAVEITGEPVEDAVESTLEIDEAGGVAGSAGCNRYFGAAEIDGHRIRMGGLGSTRMACAEPVMRQEQRFLDALERAAAWHVEAGILRLEDATGIPLVQLARIDD